MYEPWPIIPVGNITNLIEKTKLVSNFLKVCYLNLDHNNTIKQTFRKFETNLVFSIKFVILPPSIIGLGSYNPT